MLVELHNLSMFFSKYVSKSSKVWPLEKCTWVTIKTTLLPAGVDRLDKTLTVGHMQGILIHVLHWILYVEVGFHVCRVHSNASRPQVEIVAQFLCFWNGYYFQHTLPNDCCTIFLPQVCVMRHVYPHARNRQSTISKVVGYLYNLGTSLSHVENWCLHNEKPADVLV